MNLSQFLEHHGIRVNPFAEEDAQSDPVFKEHCIERTYHPTWDKVYGTPSEPATSMVFGEKGSGKTAIRLQIVRRLVEHNRDHPDRRLFVIEYDDFNPFLDRFCQRLAPRFRRADRALAEWKLWDHMDAILSLGVTGLVDRILEVKQPSTPAVGEVSNDLVRRLDRHQARDLLILAACYDRSSAGTFKGRWHKLRRKLRFWPLKAHLDLGLGIAAIIALLLAAHYFFGWEWLKTPWSYVILAAAWAPWLWRAWKRFSQAWAIVRHVRTGNLNVGPLRQVFMHFTDAEISGQPLPQYDRTDDRYEMLAKFQGLLKSLDFSGIVVLVDRIDEPHLINGSSELMRALLWPMLDNKFLKQPGIGLKLLLPIDLVPFIDREDRDFYQRARLDKQNMIPSLEWSGEALYDVANARLRACAADGRAPMLDELFEPAVNQRRLIDAFRTLRVPRHLFKFLYRLFVAHCNAFTDEQPRWKISPETFESTLALYRREQDTAEQAMRFQTAAR
jgi:hypothetical protein